MLMGRPAEKRLLERQRGDALRGNGFAQGSRVH
jgi:hypothetical protein